MPALAAAALALGFGAPALAEGREQAQLALQGIAMLDQRVATLSHKLAVAGVDFCQAKAPLAGFTVHHLSQYSRAYQDAARRQFGLGRGTRVLAVAAEGPAQRAGLRRNDLILKVDGEALPEGEGGEAASLELIEQVQSRLEAHLADGSVELLVERNGERLTIRIEGEPGCASRVNLKPSADLNAHADGDHVIVTTAIATLVRDDAELAAVLAHELAHNMLGHRARLDAAGWSPRTIRETETEADKVSIHLLHRAGIDPRAALRFWRHYGPKQQSLFSGSEHPGWRQRIEIMAEEIGQLGRQRQSSRAG